MLVIPVKDGENIDRALKRFKRKFLTTGTLKELRRRKQYIFYLVRPRKLKLKKEEGIKKKK